VAAKTLHERGIPFDCYEMGSGIGGNWRFENDNGLSAAYESLHINTSRDRMRYSDFPMPDDYPDFPHHSQILAYFEDYVDHFGFRHTIRFRTEVQRVAPVGDGTYHVTVRDLDTDETTTHTYGAVLVANGHHWDPHWPNFPGTFEGEVMHAHAYTTSDRLRDKRVLVVGAGNSACDIACEATKVATSTTISTRRGAYVIPKYLLGRPLDMFTTPFSTRLPAFLQRLTAHLLLYFTRGRQSKYGFPTPDYPFGAEHPTVSSDLLDLVGRGLIGVRPNIERLDGNIVHFEDGTEEEVDVLIYATGYNVSFPFFDADFLQPVDNRLPLYHFVVPPGEPNMYFIGLLQPLGAVMPLCEVQVKWVADLLEGKTGLPSVEQMKATIRKTTERMQRRYIPSRRHTMQVDFFPYKSVIEQVRKKGQQYLPTQALPKKPVEKREEGREGDRGKRHVWKRPFRFVS